MTASDDVSATDAAARQADDAARTLAFRRSLRASRGRRAAAVLQRRRVLRSRGSVLAATFGLLFVSGGAIAAQSGSQRSGPSSDAIKAAQSALGVAADGVVGPRTRAATKRFQRENGLSVDGVIGPQTLGALGIKSGTTTARSAKENDPVLERIAACESSGDPTAVSPDGRYHGKYQFSLATWREMGGKGNPARASEAEQDRLAAKLLDRRGTAPWPNCA